MGKLDTTAQNATTIVVDLAALDTGGAVVNGPEDLLDWDAIRWRPRRGGYSDYGNGSSRRRRPGTSNRSAICRN